MRQLGISSMIRDYLSDVDVRNPPPNEYRTRAKLSEATQIMWLWGDLEMPKKSKAKIVTPKFGETWFAASNLTTDELNQYDSWVKTSYDDFDLLFNSATSEGYKLSVSYDFENDTCVASATCRDTQSENYGGVMTSRSTVAADALFMLLWKINILYAETAWKRSGSLNSRG
jgi:hypothetical protein